MKRILKKNKPAYRLYRFFATRLTKQIDNEPPAVAIKREDILKVAHQFNHASIFIETGTFLDDRDVFKSKFKLL